MEDKKEEKKLVELKDTFGKRKVMEVLPVSAKATKEPAKDKKDLRNLNESGMTREVSGK